MSRTSPAVAALVALALHIAPAAAIDGEVLITQEKALAGGITPGDGPGYPISILAPGRYRLASNLNMPPSSSAGIRIDSSRVTIDFAGFRLVGNGTAHSCIYGRRGTKDTNIRNGTIVNCRKGIYAEFVEYWTIDNMRIHSNSDYGILGNFYQFDGTTPILIITNSQIIDNGVGIQVLGQLVIRGSVISRNESDGVFATSGTVQGNLIADNGRGVRLANLGLVLGNTIVDNLSEGLSALTAEIGYGNNTFSGNNGGGAQVSGGFQMHPNACGATPC